MPRNIEIKARIADPAGVRRLAEGLADDPAVLLEQEDRFYPTPSGRLKLRISGVGGAELIAYTRADAPGPRSSDYRIAPVADPERLSGVLAAALGGVRGVVRKRRTLLIVGRTRIHIDEVEGLGSFLELEVVLAEGDDETNGEREARALMEHLGVDASDLVGKAYIDMLGDLRRARSDQGFPGGSAQ
jgi:adenylate cyclase class IV